MIKLIFLISLSAFGDPWQGRKNASDVNTCKRLLYNSLVCMVVYFWSLGCLYYYINQGAKKCASQPAGLVDSEDPKHTLLCRDVRGIGWMGWLSEVIGSLRAPSVLLMIVFI